MCPIALGFACATRLGSLSRPCTLPYDILAGSHHPLLRDALPINGTLDHLSAPKSPLPVVMVPPRTPGPSIFGSGDTAIAGPSSAMVPYQGPADAPASGSSNNTYIMPSSPMKRAGIDGYRPKVTRTLGQRPACLVNASVTYCGNNQIYAFGGFDQYTDEVYNHVLRLDLIKHEWSLVDNYGDIPGVRMGTGSSRDFYCVRTTG